MLKLIALFVCMIASSAVMAEATTKDLIDAKGLIGWVVDVTVGAVTMVIDGVTWLWDAVTETWYDVTNWGLSYLAMWLLGKRDLAVQAIKLF